MANFIAPAVFKAHRHCFYGTALGLCLPILPLHGSIKAFTAVFLLHYSLSIEWAAFILACGTTRLNIK